MAQLKLEQVSLFAKIRSEPILDDISAEINQGDRIAIVGPSGAGKTSLLRLLNRLSEANQGHIYFEGQDIRTLPVLDLRRQIVLVLQESRLLDMTVQDALAYPLRLRNLSSSDIRQRLTTWTEALNLPADWLNRREIELSVGQRQLVAIARALMLQPKVLLLDEPTSALDAGRGTQVINLFRQLAHDQSMTILMINHQLEFAQDFCSRVLYVQKGRLVSDRRTDDVNWQQIKDDLIQAEQQDLDEWGDD